MAIVLFALFAVALMMVLVGFLLSPKSQPSVKQRTSPSSQRHHAHTVGANRRMRVGRSQEEVERHARSSIAVSLNVGSLLRQRTRHQTPWLGMALVLLSLFAFGFYSLNTLLPHSTLVFDAFANMANTNGPTTSSTPATSAQTQLFSGILGASKALTRISQLDPVQYSSSQEYTTWAYSACSAATLTEIFNAYGRHYRITDVLSVESRIGEISPDLGLVEPVGIDRTAARFGFKATWLQNPSLDTMITVANSGRPVIIGFPPDRWSGGHILIAIGGDKNNVFLADSSRLNMKVMPRATFLKYWVGFAVAVTPS